MDVSLGFGIYANSDWFPYVATLFGHDGSARNHETYFFDHFGVCSIDHFGAYFFTILEHIFLTSFGHFVSIVSHAGPRVGHLDSTSLRSGGNKLTKIGQSR